MIVEEFSSHLLVFGAAECFLLIIFNIKTHVFCCFVFPTPPPSKVKNVQPWSMEQRGGGEGVDVKALN